MVGSQEMFLALLEDECNFFSDLFGDVGDSSAIPNFTQKQMVEKGDTDERFTQWVHPTLVCFC